jgi:hypothetical protein
MINPRLTRQNAEYYSRCQMKTQTKTPPKTKNQLKIKTGATGGRLASNHNKLKIKTGATGGRLASNHNAILIRK